MEGLGRMGMCLIVLWMLPGIDLTFSSYFFVQGTLPNLTAFFLFQAPCFEVECSVDTKSEYDLMLVVHTRDCNHHY